MKDVLRAIDRGEPVTILYRGKEKATIVPIGAKKKMDIANHPYFGMWKDREDMKNPTEGVRKLRSQKLFPDLLP
jgi:antitoxin (DNA-binding transcriptional repressor) of toxin-antitoxin stability system